MRQLRSALGQEPTYALKQIQKIFPSFVPNLLRIEASLRRHTSAPAGNSPNNYFAVVIRGVVRPVGELFNSGAA